MRRVSSIGHRAEIDREGLCHARRSQPQLVQLRPHRRRCARSSTEAAPPSRPMSTALRYASKPAATPHPSSLRPRTTVNTPPSSRPATQPCRSPDKLGRFSRRRVPPHEQPQRDRAGQGGGHGNSGADQESEAHFHPCRRFHVGRGVARPHCSPGSPPRRCTCGRRCAVGWTAATSCGEISSSERTTTAASARASAVGGKAALGTAMTPSPARAAERSPLVESSTATACAASTPSRRTACRTAGEGLPASTPSVETAARNQRVSPAPLRTASINRRGEEEASPKWPAAPQPPHPPRLRPEEGAAASRFGPPSGQ